MKIENSLKSLMWWNGALTVLNAIFKNNELIINEASSSAWEQFKYNRSAYYLQIERALLNHTPIDTVGMQYHMFYPEREKKKYVLSGWEILRSCLLFWINMRSLTGLSRLRRLRFRHIREGGR